MVLWLSDRSRAAADFAATFLTGYAGTGNDINGAAKLFTRSGLTQIYAGQAAATLIGVAHDDARVPDLIGIAQQGVVYTGKKAKIAEHGGAADADRNVPVLVSGAGVDQRGTVFDEVSTTQIAPTILTLLDIAPGELQAVRAEHTHPLPNLR
jgi:hypothetical protein